MAEVVDQCGTGVNDHWFKRFEPRQTAAGLALALIAPDALFFLAVIGRSVQPVGH